MANPVYPDLPMDKASDEDLRDGREEDVTGDGYARVRKLHDDRRDFIIVHPLLSLDQAATLEAFYSLNAGALIDFTWPLDGNVYQVRFGKGAIKRKWVSASRRSYTVRLVAGI